MIHGAGHQDNSLIPSVVDRVLKARRIGGAANAHAYDFRAMVGGIDYSRNPLRVCAVSSGIKNHKRHDFVLPGYPGHTYAGIRRRCGNTRDFGSMAMNVVGIIIIANVIVTRDEFTREIWVVGIDSRI